MLKSINNHLNTLDETILKLDQKIQHMDQYLYQKETNDEYEAWDRIDHPEKYEKQPDPQLETINKNLVIINRNIINKLEQISDEEYKYYESRTDQLNDKLNRIRDLLKSIHVWNG